MCRTTMIAMILIASLSIPACHEQPGERTVALAVTVPDPAWSVQMERVYEKEGRLLVVSRLSRDPDAIAAQVISTARDTITAKLPSGPVEHLILGRTWNWGEEEHRFVSEEQLASLVAEGRLVYNRALP